MVKQKCLALGLFLIICLPFSAYAGGESKTYTVKKGDSLWKMAQQYQTSTEAIMKANNLNGSTIYPGQIIIIPSTTVANQPPSGYGGFTYRVQPGDSLWLIAGRFNISAESIRSLNNLSGKPLEVGQLLRLPPQKRTYNKSDGYWLARIISAEARGESLEGQVAVGAVVLNRVESNAFPNTIYDVIFQNAKGVYQFSVVQDGSIFERPTVKATEAAALALKGRDPTNGSLFFYNPRLTSPHNWIRSRQIVRKIGNHNFTV